LPPTCGTRHLDNEDRGKLTYLAPSESAAGAFINDVVPEQAAAHLRASWPVRFDEDSTHA
jgi:galactose-1-phosphate uridylyltransferase